jgi:hypothetical protein
MTSRIDRLSPIPPRSPVLIEHRPSHLTKSPILEAAGWAEVGSGRPAQPISRPSQPPFDLAAIQDIYSPEARLHSSTHSPFAAEE